MTMTDVELYEDGGSLAASPIAPTPEAARQAMETYQAISKALLTDEDVQTIRTRAGTRQFPKRSAFQKLSNAYRVSTKILTREIERDAEGNILRCNVVVRAIHPDGRVSDGDGACSASEDRFARGDDKIDHDLPATAVTRAKNRAISDLVAFGAVSAEEAEADQERASSGGGEALTRPAWAEPVPDVGAVAQTLTDLLGASDVAIKIGQAIFDECDGTIPVAVAHAIEHIAQTRPVDPAGPSPTEPTRTDEPAPDQDPAEAPSAPPEPPDAPAPIEVHPHPERKQEDDA